jgi:diphthamide synthase (EF-2-diphthine--ammonia ligase)
VRQFFLGVFQMSKGMMEGTRITQLFPLWGRPTAELTREMTAGGLRAQITCVDPRCLPAALARREYDDDFLKTLPDGVDPCGENGEFQYPFGNRSLTQPFSHPPNLQAVV